MMKRVPWILIGVGLLAASCVYMRVGDGGLRLRGQVVADNRPAEDCILELRLDRSGDLVKTWSVKGSFDLSFTVDPRPRDYYVHLWCQGYAATYDSPIFRYSRVETIDLGIIQILTARPES